MTESETEPGEVRSAQKSKKRKLTKKTSNWAETNEDNRPGSSKHHSEDPNTTLQTSLIGHWQNNMNLKGDEEGYHKYTSKIQFFKNELKECQGKVTLSFVNLKLKIKNRDTFYANPQEAITKGAEPREIINNYLGFLNADTIYAALEKQNATPQVLR